MTTIELQLSDELHQFVTRQCQVRGDVSPSDFIVSIVAQAQTKFDRIAEALLEGLASEETIEATPEFWKRFEREQFGAELGNDRA